MIKLNRLIPTGDGSYTTEQILEFINEANNALSLDTEVRRFEKLIHTRTKDENIKILTSLIEKHADLLDNILDKFYNHINSFLPKKGTSGRFKFLHQKKTLKSIIDKVLNRNKNLTMISDLVRGAILFDSHSDMEEFIKDFRRKSNYIIKFEEKLKGENKWGYYGAYHIDLSIDGMAIELQVMTNRLWRYKEGAHGIYDKWRTSPDKASKVDLSLSRQLFNIGNVKLREEIEDIIDVIDL
jgi:hypothetical protein